MAYVRWMVRRDMPRILAIENQSFEFPWPEEEFLYWLRQKNIYGMTAEFDDWVIGFVIYQFRQTSFQLLNLAVSGAYRHRGVGSLIVSKLAKRLCCRSQRTRIVTEVRETNLPALSFFRSLGFHAVSILRGYYSDTSEDAYLMCYRLPPEAPEATGTLPEPNILEKIARALHLVT